MTLLSLIQIGSPFQEDFGKLKEKIKQIIPNILFFEQLLKLESLVEEFAAFRGFNRHTIFTIRRENEMNRIINKKENKCVHPMKGV
jgi:hypothetical protein